MRKKTCGILLLVGILAAGSLTGCTNLKNSPSSSGVSQEGTKSSDSNHSEDNASAVTVAAIMENTEENQLNFKIRLKSQNKVQLTWNSVREAEKYKITRRDENWDNKKVYTFSPNVTTFQQTLEKDKQYYYILEAVWKGKEKDDYDDIYTETADAYTGVFVPWGKNWWYSTLEQKTGWTNATHITIFNRSMKLSHDAGIVPDGVEIYRGDTEDSCRYIGEMEYSKFGDSVECDYVDEDVVPGQIYYYKRRNYKETAKGRLYSLFSDTARIQAVSQNGNYRVWAAKKEKKTEKKNGKKKTYLKSLTMAIHNSSVGNGDLRTYSNSSGDYYAYETEDVIKTFKVVKYSFDGVNWTDMSKKETVTVHPEQTIYLKMEPKKKVRYSSLKNKDNYLVYTMEWDHTNGYRKEFKYYFAEERTEVRE